jgi:ubiquinone/menaquinone biosynthesis C-methylase UbiE
MNSAVSAPETAPTQAVFLNEWQIYRKMVDNNYLHHREAYACLGDILRGEVDRPFRFLDIACGDASATRTALAGTRVAQYAGIDLSAAALKIAEPTLADLGCPVRLQQGDFTELLPLWSEQADIVWIGLSLHHLRKSAKLDMMKAVRRILSDRGKFLIYENASPDGEDREGWILRYERQRMTWGEYTPDESEVMGAHARASDFPETDAGWRELGRDAGFSRVTERYRSPTDLFRLYSFEENEPR